MEALDFSMMGAQEDAPTFVAQTKHGRRYFHTAIAAATESKDGTVLQDNRHGVIATSQTMSKAWESSMRQQMIVCLRFMRSQNDPCCATYAQAVVKSAHNLRTINETSLAALCGWISTWSRNKETPTAATVEASNCLA